MLILSEICFISQRSPSNVEYNCRTPEHCHDRIPTQIHKKYGYWKSFKFSCVGIGGEGGGSNETTVNNEHEHLVFNYCSSIIVNSILVKLVLSDLEQQRLFIIRVM